MKRTASNGAFIGRTIRSMHDNNLYVIVESLGGEGSLSFSACPINRTTDQVMWRSAVYIDRFRFTLRPPVDVPEKTKPKSGDDIARYALRLP